MSKPRVQFIHGLEGSPQGRKAQVLGSHFETRTPSMDTSDFQACVDTQAREMGAFSPEVLVGSSFGGAVAVALLQKGFWTGPTLLLAQAAHHYLEEPCLPKGVRVVLVHAPGDELVDFESSWKLAQTGTPELVELVEVEDSHPLPAFVERGDLVRWVERLAKGE